MRNSILLVLFVLTLVFADDKPTNYFAAKNAARAQQQQVNNYAVWNTSSNSWINVLPLNPTGTVRGIVSVGTGLLAYGDFTSIGGNPAAGLAYYDGSVWCAPEGVGLFNYAPNVNLTQYSNAPTATSGAFAATVVGNDVYLLGTFNQVGLVRDGVAGFVRLTWSQGGVFSINKIGNQGYYQVVSGLPCTFCQNSTQPSSGTRNKLMSYTTNGQTYFVFQDSSPGDLYQWAVDTPNWVKLTNANTARNITGKVADFDISSNGILFVVGNFQNLQDPIASNQFLYIACSLDQGNTWNAVGNPQPLPVANFGDLPPLVNNVTGAVLPALNGIGLFSIAVESPTSIYVAGGWRVTERNVSIDNLAGQIQTRVIRISGSSYTLVSERWVGNSASTINKLVLANGILYAFGDIYNYRQVVPTNGTRFGVRYIESYKGAACLSNNVWAPAFGGFLTTSYSGDTTPTTVMTAFSNNLMYFYGSFQSTYGVLSGGVFAYGGDKKLKRDRRWNAVLQNQRFVSAISYNGGVGNDATIYSLYVTKRNDALIIGGQFDWIGSQRIGGIAAYNPVSDTVQQIGGGIYQANQVAEYYGDNFYNNRIGGIVLDIEEWNDRLIIGGKFNRNNTGACVSNIAWNKFRQSGAGWEAIDGGCDNTIFDLLVVGNTLYITGAFQFCGLNPSGYNGGLYRGSIPTSKIARIDLGDNKRSWRNLGIGLQGGSGRALAWRNGVLYVGGDFSSAGGKISTAGIARWRGDHWEDVVAKCRGNCDRPVNVLPYIGTSEVPDSNSRKPSNCFQLRNIEGRIYCVDNNLNRLAWFSSNTWYQAADYSVTISGFQNSVISRNATKGNLINVPSVSSDGSNGANFVSYDADNNQFAPSNGGFSVAPNAMAAGSNIFPSMILAFIVLILSFIF